jgi:hypothetical protein
MLKIVVFVSFRKLLGVFKWGAAPAALQLFDRVLTIAIVSVSVASSSVASTITSLTVFLMGPGSGCPSKKIYQSNNLPI